MRKKLFLVAALVAVTLSAAATVGFKSWCGKVVYTIDFAEVPEYMTDEDIKAFYQELNVELCGSEGEYELIYY